VIPNLHRAFPAGQTAGTRLVLTQATYQLQRWLDWLDASPDVEVVADMTAAAPPLAREAWARRGPWAKIQLTDAHPGGDRLHDVDPLLLAFVQPDPQRRLVATEAAAAVDPTNPALQLAVASTFMELMRLDDAESAIERALTLAVDWEAAHFELGKLWLRREETERAVRAFTDAGRLMPSFSAAFGNLGAALGELERPEEALAALHQALQHDPNGHSILNNIGVVSRELGDLARAEMAFRRVINLAPDFVFGHYNLGHTLFLEGRFLDARAAYEQGLERDPQRNARQAARAAVVRAAAGDADGAIAQLADIVAGSPQALREDLLLEAESTLTALSAVPDIDASVTTMLLFVRDTLSNTKGAP
jgi:tetratricopeptide (TPR) repeat protein